MVLVGAGARVRGDRVRRCGRRRRTLADIEDVRVVDDHDFAPALETGVDVFHTSLSSFTAADYRSFNGFDPQKRAPPGR